MSATGAAALAVLLLTMSTSQSSALDIRVSGGDAASARLAAVLPDAAERLLKDDECFGILERHGVTMMREEARDRLRVIRVVGTSEVCAGVRARAVVGVPLIFACPRFAELRGRDARMTATHELLHLLGLGEAPSCLDCPSAGEIQREVDQACR